MTVYTVADATTNLPGLIDKALDGEQIVITRQGKPVAELKPLQSMLGNGVNASYEWLRALRQSRKGIGQTSVELLNQMYDEPPA